MIDDNTFKLLSLALQFLVVPAAGVMTWLAREVIGLRVMLYRDFATKAEVASEVDQLREDMRDHRVRHYANGANRK